MITQKSIFSGLAVLCAVLLFSCTENENKGSTGTGTTEPPSAPGASGSPDGGHVVTETDENGETHTFEVHTFTYDPEAALNNQTEYTLTFPADFAGVTANVIVVAGGGGGGGANGMDSGGGGGGGGVIYDLAYIIPAGTETIAVKVGNGSAGGAIYLPGSTGNDSEFGNLIAKGGGGGGGTNQVTMQGLTGGSSGGGGCANNWHAGNSPDPFDEDTQGNHGGAGSGTGGLDCGGGGGGAGSVGTDGAGNIPGAGGAALKISGIPYHGELDFSPGGMGGAVLTTTLTTADAAQPPSEYGGGGNGGTGTFHGTDPTTDATSSGAAGKEGIVIIWWDTSTL